VTGRSRGFDALDGRAAARRPGTTLPELLVVLVVLAVVAGVTTLALRVEGATGVDESDLARIATARKEALRSGRAIVVALPDSIGGQAATVLPDGSVIADSTVAIDRFTGRARNARR
jgi:prepilin-type N-terminal cleavage/methylation domain-containing protein